MGEPWWATAGGWMVTFLLVMHTVKEGLAIDCFECFSLDGNRKDCEDQFGPVNTTGHLIARNCRVGYHKFRANFCVKIKGMKKANGQSVLIRTCSAENWGTQCGDLLFEQGDETKREPLTGCLASCDSDGCNTASHISATRLTTVYLPILLTVVLQYDITSLYRVFGRILPRLSAPAYSFASHI